MPRPTVFIVTGAWHNPIHYEPFANLLQSAGYEVLNPPLPTCNPSMEAPYPDMHDDAGMVASGLRHLIEDCGKDVLLAPHSYGGVPALQAADRSLAKDARIKAGKRGGLIGLFSICAFIVPSNTSLEDLNGGRPAPFINIDGNGLTTTKDPEQLFFHDLSEDKQKHYAGALLQQPAKAHASKVTTDPVAYRFLPTGVVICEDDQATPPAVQRLVLENMRQDGAQITQVYPLHTSHSPQLSKPRELLRSVEDFVGLLGG